MAIVKSQVFTAPDVLSKAARQIENEHTFEPEQKKGFLQQALDSATTARQRANTLRTHVNLAVACAQTDFKPDDVAEIAARVSVQTLEEMGFNLDEPSEKVERALPSICRAATDAIARLVGHVRTAEELEAAGSKVARALAGISRNSVLSRYSNKHYPDDLDVKTAITLTSIASMATMSTLVDQFSFEMGAAQALKHANEAIARGFVRHAADWIESEKCAPASKVMLMQSLYTAVAEIYQACWQAEAARTATGLRRGIERGMDREALLERIKERIVLVDKAFEVRLNDVMALARAQNQVITATEQAIAARVHEPVRKDGMAHS